MATICVDLGGTLIDDPFSRAIDCVKQIVRGGALPFPFPDRFIDKFFAEWTDENSKFDFPFASHFLQEEVWPMRAALKITSVYGLGAEARLPQMLPSILNCYRASVKELIAQQPQLGILRSAIASLRGEGHCIGVASNDREFATRAMLAWTELDVNVGFVFTSERLSRRYPGAEKPALEFFRAIECELAELGKVGAPVIYVGDSELKDILPSTAAGWRAVRFFNPNQTRSCATWLGGGDTTAAPICYRRFDEFEGALTKAVRLSCM